MSYQPKQEKLYDWLLANTTDNEESESDMVWSPEMRANIFSRFTFAWMTPLLEKGRHTPLTMEDTFPLKEEFHPDKVSAKLQRHWQRELKRQKPSLLRASIRTFGSIWALSSVFKLASDLVSFLNPILLSRLLGFVANYNTPEGEPIEYGYFYAASMFIVACVQTLAAQQHFVQNQRIRSVIKAGYTTVIYQKAMLLSNDTRQKYNVGSIISHMTVDAHRVSNFTANSSNNLWSIPLQFVIAMYLLYRTLGWTTFAGVMVILATAPATARISQHLRIVTKKLNGYRDKRLGIMNEILSGIKIVKLYAWDSFFIKRINDVRVKMELVAIQRKGVIQALFSFVSVLLPFVVSFSTFALYSLADNKSHGPLNSQLVFVLLALFNLIKKPLTLGPTVVPELLEAMVCFTRLYNFLTAEEIDLASIERAPYDRYESRPDAEDTPLISVQDGTFKWLSADEPVVKNVSIQCKRNELLAIVGQVGSGKSSLISAILGEMIKYSGDVAISGSIAYVPQQPWIMNATLRDNILFGNSYDEEFYNRVIKACALGQDIDSLSARDMTELGERGVNLSGGQKMRVSLARAIYARADVYILDDPLAAVDAHVSKHIFTHVIGPQGMLQSRARIFVTNALQYLNSVDSIAMLRDGCIIEQGLSADVMAQEGEIFAFAHKYIQQNQESPEGSIKESSADSADAISDCPDLKRKDSTQSLGRPDNNNTGNAISRRNIRMTQESSGRTIVKEVSRQGKVEWGIYRTYVRACGILNMSFFLLVMLLSSASNVTTSMWLKHWASANSGSNIPQATNIVMHSIVYYLAIYGGLGLVDALVNSMRSLIMWTRCSIRASTSIHRDMLNGVMRSPMSFFDTTPTGRILNRFSSDLQNCDATLPRSVSRLIDDSVNVISSVVIICFSTPLMIFIILPLVIFYRTLQQLYLFSSRELKRLDSTTRSPMVAHFQETLGGISTIRAYSLQSRFIYENQGRLHQHMRSQVTHLLINRWLALRLESMGNIVMLGTTMFSIITLHYTGVGDAGMVGLAVTYALTLSSTLSQIVRAQTSTEKQMTHLERAVEYMHLPSEGVDIVEDYRPKETWPEQGVVEFKNFSTRYREGLDLVLKDLSFRVAPRHKVGIIGRTGSGKSSLSLSLFRIIEAASGQILLDDEDITKYGLFDVRNKLSIIPQDPVLFAGTVRENVDPFNNYSDQEIWHALEEAHLAEYIRSKDERLEFIVAQNGENFSAGQKQLICLARVLLKHTKVLVLDEATASIDIATDELIQQTIRDKFKDCTVLTIAHRVNTIIDSDMVLVVDKGRLAEYDTPQNLLANKDSIFTKLVEESQSSNI
ncbi:hypothetical protein H4S08_001460 [Coemansia sp. RSA 1365]|nr:hypothetical protein H4S08_001460 [Coemansia sp. RSA 1365]